MSDSPQQSPRPARPMRQALAILLTLTGGLLMGSAARSEAAVNDKTTASVPPTPITTTATVPGTLSFEERVAKAREQLMVATPADQVEGTQVYWRNWANWRWGNGGWRNWNNWNNWRNWSNWSNWNNW